MRSDMFAFQTIIEPAHKNVKRFLACLDGKRFKFFEVNTPYISNQSKLTVSLGV